VRPGVQRVVASRNSTLLQEQLDRALGWSEPSPFEERAFLRTYWYMMPLGAAAWLHHGEIGAKVFLDSVEHFFKSARRRGGRPTRRMILNLLAYEAKAAFYLCYANTWVDLIPWLREHRGLDETSERFLRFWHHQDRPVELPHGQTRSGLLVPTHVR